MLDFFFFWKVLSDPQKREVYDQLGETGMMMMEDPFAAKDVSETMDEERRCMLGIYIF